MSRVQLTSDGLRCYRYNQNQLYDHLIYRLFETRVHKQYQHNIYFSERGLVDRTAALKQALLNIQTRFKETAKVDAVGTINIFPPASPAQCVNLQAIDYCLWALQRYYVRGEDEFLKKIWPAVSVIHEMDSKTGKKRGITYTRSKHPFGVLKSAGNIGRA